MLRCVLKMSFAVIVCGAFVAAEADGKSGVHVMRFSSGSDKAAVTSAGNAWPVTFGLSQRQRAQIYSLSAKDIDLRHFYFVAGSSAFADAFANNPAYLGAHPEVALPPHYGAPVAVPNGIKEDMDPDLLGQWWAGKHRMTSVWKYATGKGVVIADCDTGFYTNEADLKFNLKLEHSRDISDIDSPARISDGRFVFHGTAVAALISGVRDDRGTNGIAFNAKLVPLQYYNFDPALDDLDKEEATARCILHAIKIPAVKVIVVQNQTTSGSAETFAGTREAVKLAIRSGITVVVSGGNSSLELTTEARNDTGSIIVGAVNADGSAAAFSNFGRRVSVSAYGEKLYTLYGPSGRMDSFGGTTAAAAQVGATVALMLEVNPRLTNHQIKAILEDTALRSPRNDAVGGLLNILGAVQEARGIDPEWRMLDRQESFRNQIVRVLGPQ